ncbi:hypothetical protein H7U19_07340 [Hyunsoonleella sp. SJ7]|uniref:Uncharacterized protein n=1 Tax=Hyunsoonleella aquatilis TaxID=2762758 RepID=A0A923KGG1_9FLAO|nr:hypothetical protein [Hyunsoonleella aquatilis]MBC3758211.1 hypothetical protein [Hyunsoonleella aquatilis]
MKTEKWIPIKKVVLKNNCPECFSKDGLHLTFKQKFVESSFYKSVTKDINTEIHCDRCESQIYPERWTADIERVFDYQQKAFTPRPGSKYYKKLFWIIAITAIVMLFAVTVLLSLQMD